jgi:myo-inositol-1-phosphate synthase
VKQLLAFQNRRFLKMTKEIRVAIVGVGNCASSLVQGIHYYKDAEGTDYVPGLMHTEIGPYKIRDLKVVVAFDVDSRKVSTSEKTMDVSEAIYSEPNNTLFFCKDVPHLNAPVHMGHLYDGVSQLMQQGEDEGYPIFKIAKEQPVDVVQKLKDNNVDVLVNYLPVGSRDATAFYAQCAIDAGCAMVNAMPRFIASDPEWSNKFKEAGLPVIGDDIKSQFGATFPHRLLIQGCVDRGVRVLKTKQVNVGGNTDFRNMMDRERLKDKLASKTDSIEKRLPYKLQETLYAGPGSGPEGNGPKGHGFVAEQKDNKVAEIEIEATGFGDVPLKIFTKVDCFDSPNSAGIVIDAIRCCQLARDLGKSGTINSASAWFFKHPLHDIPDSQALRELESFIGEYQPIEQAQISPATEEAAAISPEPIATTEPAVEKSEEEFLTVQPQL